MGAIEDWNVFARGLAPEPAAGSGCSGWSLVFARRGRALALPDSARSQPAGLDFFVRTPSKWWWAQLLMRCHRLTRGLLPEAHLSAEQYRELRRIVSGTYGELGEEAGEVLGIQFGSSGPLQKVMVLGSAFDGSWNVAKLALRPSADGQILAEAAWLKRLAGCPRLAAHVPAVTGAGNTALGRPYFVMRAVGGEPVPGTFTGRQAVPIESLVSTSHALVCEQPHCGRIEHGCCAQLLASISASIGFGGESAEAASVL